MEGRRVLSSPCLLCLILLLCIFTSLTSATTNKTSRRSTIPKKIGEGYRLISVEESSDGGLIGYLQVKKKNHIYGPDIPNLQLYVKHETGERLRVRITDAEKPRWEVPYNLLPRQQPPPSLPPKSRKITLNSPPQSNLNLNLNSNSSELIFSYTSDPFTFTIKRKSTSELLFTTTPTLVFKDQYLELTTKLPTTASLYGLGENTQPNGIKLVPNEPYTLYTTDASAINLNTDLYGSHPMYMDLRQSSSSSSNGMMVSSHAVLLLNSNGMDVFYRGESLTYKVIGGVLDFYFFAGPSPLDVVNQYTSLIGRPAPMPYWAFGFHQCRWGYHNLSVVEDVVANYAKSKIPLDVIWNDDDHMDFHKDFTLNPIAYPRPKLLSFLEKVHSSGMKYIVLIDPGIAVNNSYGVYTRGIAQDVFIKYGGKPYLAQVWPGAVNFPDYLNPKTVDWWVDEIKRFHELVPVDGLWIDMNEASNFCSGLCKIPVGIKCPSVTGPGWDCCLDCKNLTKTKWDDPPYKINASGKGEVIGFKTIATSAEHYNGVLEYDAHSIYGFSETIATHKALLSLEGKRPFILTRSTYVGSGKYAAHWTGDNQGTWNDLRYSISTMLNFGIFGVPMVGSDICGFYPQPTEELCNRWIELGAFYPFSRDHANYYSPRQELYQWETVAESARNALGMRYRLLPYLYTLSYEAHMTGAPIARPLFFTFTNWTQCYGLSTQFLLGSGVMVSPVLEKGVTTVKALFPPGKWYNLFDLMMENSGTPPSVVESTGEYVTLNAPLNYINVHVYENTILPMQGGGLVSKDARMTPYSLVVTFPRSGTGTIMAKGSLYVDEDELPEMGLSSTGETATYVEFYGTVSKDGEVKVWSEVENGEFAMNKGWKIEKVSVLGVMSGDGSESVMEIEVDGEMVDDQKVEMKELEQSYVNAEIMDNNGKMMMKKSVAVQVSGLDLPIGKKFSLTWKMGTHA